eukprot:TRINITY_DN26821_c0_g1_i1.p1 TRINITY_DN26821_c0_g1~~TRINITY_DN26821_c0_g1_i1.p1  ORF type:complete len:506 (+),score=67.59 TRINITY_DN26821_c0_g1_i1:58-1575(+)
MLWRCSALAALCALGFSGLEVAAVTCDHVHATSELPGTRKQALAGTFSGYLPTFGPEGEALEIFYYFKQHANKSKPLLVWMNGGPGASSLMGLFTELGPFLLNSRSRPAAPNGSWKLFENPHSWSLDASILAWEQPAGVGFSRCKKINCSILWNDETSADANLAFLLAFFAAFPQERSRDLYIAGESYAGVYVPMLTSRVLKHDEGRPIRLRGMIVGDGCIGYNVPGGGGSDTMHLLLEYFEEAGAGIDRVALGSARSACGQQLFRPMVPQDMTAACQVALRRVFQSIGPFNVYHMDGPCGPDGQGNWGEGDAFACGSEEALTDYLSMIEVQKALNAIPANATETLAWQMWDGDGSNYNITVADARPFYREVLDAGIPVLIYNGLRDTALPFNGAEKWTADMGKAVAQPRRLWGSGGNVAGHVTTYSNGLTFVTVQGAGHLVPADRPVPARTMISAFLARESLPTYNGKKCSRIWLGRGWGHFCGDDEAQPQPKGEEEEFVVQYM